MAKCGFCKRDMLTACDCIKVPIVIDKEEYEPIKMGAVGDFCESTNIERCHDCGAMKGNYHHPGCDCERCPKCGGQLISCGCSKE